MCRYVLLWRWTRPTVTCTVATIEVSQPRSAVFKGKATEPWMTSITGPVLPGASISRPTSG